MIEQATNLYDIALIGMTGRFPGANTVEQFWENLAAGVESIHHFSDAELAAAGVPQSLISHPDYVKAGAILPTIAEFDAGFFGFSPKEAATMNPQQRLFLECAWESLERAGYNPENFPGRIGIYAGAASNHYLTPAALVADDEIAGLQLMVGNDPDYLATQVAYKLNLTGPALTVQTACSTSLVAVHQACQSLLNHECDMALAGGITILLPHLEGYLYVEGSINSPDGHCRTFADKAQGTVPGSGVGVVVLKRLADAQADGDTILAVVKGTAVNNDGALKIGYTAPSQKGQANVIADAQAMAAVAAETISYIETHGTGTPLGDPIEMAALTQAFRAQTAKVGFCQLGAVKTNIGHLGAAAGVAGLIKTVLALQNQSIPTTLHFTQPNPKIDFANSPFRVNSTTTPWPRRTDPSAHPRRAGVSSFGIGGTNAHLIIEEAPELPPSGDSRPWQLLLFSAQSPAALEQMTENLRTHLTAQPADPLSDIAYTLQMGRKRFAYGRLVVCQTTDEGVAALAQPTVEPVITLQRTYPTRPVVFMFSGQGSQYVDMGRELYQHEPLFRQTVDDCAEILRVPLGLDLRTILYPTAANRTHAANQLAQTAFTQPALFVIEYALAQLWQSWGIKPQAMIGHSIGEYVAACLAGVFSLNDALHVVAARGRLMQAQPTGDMLAVALSANTIQPYMNGTLSLAAINGPQQAVIAGPTAAIDALKDSLTAQGIKATHLSTSHAFHSAMMEPMLEPFAAVVAKVTLNPPTLPFLSNLTGDWITAAQATDPAYWVRHVRQPVNFTGGLEKLLTQPEWILLEVGPGTSLTNLATHHPERAALQTVLASLPHANDKRSALQYLLQTLGQLYLQGVDIAWADFYAQETRRRIQLPTYPFQRQHYWIDAPAVAQGQPISLDKKLPLAQWFAAPTWHQSPPSTLLPQWASTASEQPYLLLLDEVGVGDRLAARLRQQGETVITVAPGASFAQLAADHYTLNPASRAEYQALLGALAKNGQTPHTLIHLWQITGDSAARTIDNRLQALEELYQHGFDSLLSLAQALGERGDQTTQQIIVVANGLHAVLGDEPLSPEKATLLGCCRVITQEYPHLTCRSVDLLLPSAVETPADAGDFAPLIQQLADEVRCAADDTVVAYRGRRRWVQSFEPVPLLEPAQTASQDAVGLRPHGVYLITAGLHETGLRLAEVLTQSCQARLVLIDDAALDPADTVHERIKALQAQGGAVLPLRATVTDLPQMQQAIAKVTAHFGALHGVIHIPSVSNDGLIQMKTLSATRAVLEPSVRGTLVLEAALQGLPLDFMALFGSTVAISGGIGQVDECAAYAFLGAYAHSRQWTDGTQPSLVTAIDWALWQWDDRYEQAMAEFLQVQTQFRAHREQFGITQAEAGAAFMRILHSGQPHLIVAPQGIAVVLEQQRTLTMQNVVTQLASHTPAPVAEQRHDQAFAAPVDELETTIAQVWQDVFGLAQVGRHDNFFTLGGHSLLSIQLISRLRTALQLPELPLSLLFEAPTVGALATVLRASQPVAELSLEELALNGDADMAALLAEIEELSAAELVAVLATER